MTYTFSIAFHWLGPLNTPSCVWDSLSYVLVGLPGGSVVKNQPASAEASGDVSSIPGWGRCPGEESGTLLQYGQRSLAGYSLFDCKESGMTVRLSMHASISCVSASRPAPPGFHEGRSMLVPSHRQPRRRGWI